MKKKLALALLVLALSLAACRETPLESPPDLVHGGGIVEKVGLPCPWLLRADDGPVYELTALGPEFQQEGLRVRFTLKPRRDYVSTCMVGTIADVVSIAKE